MKLSFREEGLGAIKYQSRKDLSALPGNIYLHKLDQEIGRIRHKYEIPMRIRSVLSQFSGRIDDQAVEEASFNAPQDNGAIFLGRVKSIQRKAAFHSLVSSWHTPPTSTPFAGGTRKLGERQESKKTPSSRVTYRALSRWSSGSIPSLFLCAGVPKAEFYGRERNNCAMRDRKISRRGLLIELGGEARPVIRPERRLARALELLIEIQKRLTHFLQSGLNIWSAGSTAIAARSTVEFPGTVIREVPHSKKVSPFIPPRTTPIQFLREQEKRLWVRHRIHITACHLRSAVHFQFRNLGKSLSFKELMRGMSGRRSLLDALRSEQGAIGRSLTIGHECNDPEVVIVYSEGGGRKKGTLGGIFQQRIPHTDRGPYKKDTPKASGSRSH
ncbi:hypothetical protein MKX01_010457 [Papaver californicum]|nr:hypothetical protein MKX01_010457 [Papaver californicum]